MRDSARGDPRLLEGHFAFGENWADYATGVDEARIAGVERALRRLLGESSLVGCRFLDIGCGSGVHAAAALRLGAVSVLAVDIDPASVATTRTTLLRFAPTGGWEAREASVFDLDPTSCGGRDVVYAWGSLHHTGAMWAAIERAAQLVPPGGRLALGLYRRTFLCGLWRLEKRAYVALPPGLQRLARTLYVGAFRLGLAVRGRSFASYVRDYGDDRGMDFLHDVHDWLGGWPYESARPEEVRAFVTRLGFVLEREFVRPGGFGWLGSGNDEFVFRRT